MRLLAGTSGFSYDEWKGTFYPEELKAADRLRYYAERLRTVEINNTFYRMPKRDVLEKWAGSVPEDFLFVLKASRRITHRGRLRDVSDAVSYLCSQADTLGPRLGPILFQLPPYLKKDVPLLDDFLAAIPEGKRAALEFRSGSWYDDAVFDTLKKHGAALCVADWEDESRAAPFVATGPFGYLRLRAPDYSDVELVEWAERILSQPWDEAFVFFKHEDEGAAPRLALRLLELSAPSGRETVSLKPVRKAEPPAPPAKRERG